MVQAMEHLGICYSPLSDIKCLRLQSDVLYLRFLYFGYMMLCIYSVYVLSIDIDITCN